VFDADWHPKLIETWDTYKLTESWEFFKKALHEELAK
jgi:hypothetical protein